MSQNEGTDTAPSTRDRIFDYLVRYKRDHDGNSPSLREIADACHIALSGARYHLTRLEIDNRIRISGKRSRTIEIIGGTWQPPDVGGGGDPAGSEQAAAPNSLPPAVRRAG
jgi:hypothetical protein